MVAIAARGLTKNFDDVVALDSVDLEITPGDLITVTGAITGPISRS